MTSNFSTIYLRELGLFGHRIHQFDFALVSVEQELGRILVIRISLGDGARLRDGLVHDSQVTLVLDTQRRPQRIITARFDRRIQRCDGLQVILFTRKQDVRTLARFGIEVHLTASARAGLITRALSARLRAPELLSVA